MADIILPFSEIEADIDDRPLLLGTINITENGEYDVTRYQVANVEVGGGGSSDFSTAEVTFAFGGDTTIKMPLPTIISGEEYNMIYIEDTLWSESETHLVPLYKGLLMITEDEHTGIVSVSGDCEYEDGQFIITGDCTITLTPAS